MYVNLSILDLASQVWNYMDLYLVFDLNLLESNLVDSIGTQSPGHYIHGVRPSSPLASAAGSQALATFPKPKDHQLGIAYHGSR